VTDRLYPALVLRFTTVPATDQPLVQDLTSAALDDWQPIAIQETDDGWRVFFSNLETRDRAAEALPLSLPTAVSVETIDVPDENWARRSQEGLKAIQVGRVIVAPPWAASDAVDSDILRIIVQPSMGFGTGHHASTRLCTALLQRLTLGGRSVLDVGTGSGVLALVAQRLGATPVVAMDNDADAIDSARENLELNGVADIELRLGDLRELDLAAADVVTANLTGGLLVRVADRLVGLLNAGGSIILSGVTREEEADVMAAFARSLRLVDRVAEDEWVGLCFARPLDAPAGGRPERTADEWIRRLKMEPHPEGGYFVETYRASEQIPATALPPRYGAPRAHSTAIFFLLRNGQVSAFHRLRSDEMWHYHGGSAATVWVIGEDGAATAHRIGPNPEQGDVLQLLIPAGRWFGAEVEDANGFILVGCTVAPGFAYEDFELADRAALTARYPQHAALIERLTEKPA
jgi:uncharacterized protein